MRPITPVSPANVDCRLHWSTAGTAGAWPLRWSAVIQTHPVTTSSAKNRVQSSLSGARLLVGNRLDPLCAPQHAARHQRHSPNPHSAC
jgi:hypothetical protein